MNRPQFRKKIPDHEIFRVAFFILKYLVSCERYKVLVKSEINLTKLLEYYYEEIKRLNALIKNAGSEQADNLQK